MVWIITDSAADLEPEELCAMGVSCVPITVSFGDRDYQENVTLSKAEFYALLQSEKLPPRTAQPSPYEFINALQEARDCGDGAVVITISSALSGTFQGAVLARELLGYETCYVVDSLLVSVIYPRHK